MRNWKLYQEQTYQNNVNNLLIEFLECYDIGSAVDLGCGSGNETVYMLKKGIKVFSIDKILNRNFIMDRVDENLHKNVIFIENSFENVDFPKVDMIGAFFSIPFCDPIYFNDLWNKIYDALEVGGFFVGQLFGDRDDFSIDSTINTFSKEDVDFLLSKYVVIKCEEIEYIRASDSKKWHFFNIIVRKD